MTMLILAFAAGFLGSFHCIGMCGGFACALGRDPSGGKAAAAGRHLLYNTGRLTTYCFLGALAGGLGHAVSSGPLDIAQRVLAIAAGLLMIAMALQFFGLLKGFHRVAAGFGTSTFVHTLRGLTATRSRAAPVALGAVNGFLPCPLVYAFAAQAASTATPLSGALVMLAFGLGTFPAMLTMGAIGQFLSPVWRRRGVRLAGAAILALGLVTLGRGILPLDSHSGHTMALGQP